MPHWLEKRPTTSTGVAIPWMHTEESEDDENMNILAFMNPDKVATGIHFRRCGVCGVKISPMEPCHFLSAAESGLCAFVTPPMHEKCVEYYLNKHEQLHTDLGIERVDDLHKNFCIGSSTRFHAEWEDDIDAFVCYTKKEHTLFKGTSAVNYRLDPLIVDVTSNEEE